MDVDEWRVCSTAWQPFLSRGVRLFLQLQISRRSVCASASDFDLAVVNTGRLPTSSIIPSSKLRSLSHASQSIILGTGLYMYAVPAPSHSHQRTAKSTQPHSTWRSVCVRNTPSRLEPGWRPPPPRLDRRTRRSTSHSFSCDVILPTVTVNPDFPPRTRCTSSSAWLPLRGAANVMSLGC